MWFFGWKKILDFQWKVQGGESSSCQKPMFRPKKNTFSQIFNFFSEERNPKCPKMSKITKNPHFPNSFFRKKESQKRPIHQLFGSFSKKITKNPNFFNFVRKEPQKVTKNVPFWGRTFFGNICVFYQPKFSSPRIMETRFFNQRIQFFYQWQVNLVRVRVRV